VGWFIIANPKLATTFKIAGALFLVGYALKSWVSAWSIQGMDINPSNSPSSRWPTILTLLAFTFLNPHTYVDTLLLIGSLGAQFPAEEHLAFILGAVLASGLWFYSLTYGAQFLTPYFKHWRTWQILDIIIGIIMMALALNLIWPLLG
jgi:L-lysine exporter family protein LysE/ArgO